MRYIYGCENNHEKEVEHPMHDTPEVICDKCGDVMRKIPQPFTFYMNPFETITDQMTHEFGAYRHKGRQGVDEYRKKKGEII